MRRPMPVRPDGAPALRNPGAIVDNILQFMRGLGAARLLLMGVVVLGVVGLLIFATTRVSTGSMTTLYSGLDPKEAGVIIQRLEAQQIPYQLKGDGTTIMVSDDQAAKLRMQLAVDGLPSGGSVGYELFDKADSLGTTSFTQNLNNLRALEGELSRTIKTLNRIENARVHLVLPERQLFQREQRNATASVVLKVRGELGRGEVAAIQHLVATAVPGLTPDHVAIVDERGTLLANGQGQDQGGPMNSAEERNQAKEAQMRSRIQELVASIVGPDKVRVQVAAEMDYSRAQIEKEEYNPDQQVVRSSQTLNQNDQSNERGPNDVTVGNNLPEGQINQTKDGSGATNSKSTRTDETINYEIGKTKTTQVIEPGQVKRISVAVLVDGNYTIGADGTKTYAERSPDEITRIENLVKTAIGFDQKRGDQVLVQNLQFAPLDQGLAVAEKPFFMGLTKDEVFRIGQMLILAFVALLVVLLVLRPIVQRALGTPATSGGGGLQLAGMGLPQLAGPGGLDPSLLSAQALPEPSSEVDQMINIAQIEGRVKASSVKKVGEIIEKHPEEAIAILRSWLYEAK